MEDDSSARVKELEQLLRDEKVITSHLSERVERLEAELDAMVASTVVSAPSGNRSFLSKIKSSKSVEKKPMPHKKIGVIARRPSENTAAGFKVNLVAKEESEKKLIREALKVNRLLCSLEPSQIQDIVDSMSLKTLSAGDNVIEEGTEGEEFYISASGKYEVFLNGSSIKTFGTGVVFGELAILYGCQRTATVKALANTTGSSEPHSVWCLDRAAFQMITMRVGVLRHRQYLRFVKPVFSHMKEEQLVCLVDALVEERYAAGEFIINQGALGETFYIVQEGTLNVTQRENKNKEKVLRSLKVGDTFGEKALETDDVRTASVVAVSDSTVLALDRATYFRLFGRDGKQESTAATSIYEADQPSPVSSSQSTDAELSNSSITDFSVLGRLGAGGFGRVDLVKLQNTDRTFALKCLAKKEIVARKQQAHVFSERDLQASITHPLIVRLYRTFRDARYLYMLLEPCLGGEMWCVLRQCGRLTECEARFVVACVVEAIAYLHRRHIVFRDLKPGNLMLDGTGYCKLVDFGFAKYLPPSVHKTWTFCGTPEYMTPEVILNRGHNFSVDYWAIGILIFELLSGWPPFSSSDPLFTYNQVLSGFEQGKRFPAVDFPAKAKDLVLALCQHRPTERLGVGTEGVDAIRRHKWFGAFSWIGLREHTLDPPIMPELKGNDDLTNFDQNAASRNQKKTPPEDFSGWDEGF
ncbi:cGMP-dependent protein kinase 1-like [Sycon ciliatum]|uniref:cGMP-dependent protein kinase 1-like n=1 Tax=Sycon ciliatum TaxID=27933 RepID=UPI0020AB7BB1|eukprot:scpid39410/ scgid19745/ cGMP-dependent protein kinase 1; cGMP-dependent protein kinase I